MAAKKKSLLQRLEKTSTVLKFAVALGSGYLLYKKWQKDQLEDQLLAQARAVAASGAATSPLTAPGITVLPTSPAQTVAYQAASPDQVDTSRQLQTSPIQSLDPSEVATQALNTLVNRLAAQG